MKRPSRILALALAVAAIPAIAATALAHDPGLSSSVVTLSRESATAVVRVHDSDLAAAGEEIDAAGVLVLSDGHGVVHASAAARTSDREGESVFSLSFSIPREAVLEVSVPLLDRLPRGHKHHLEVRTDDGALLASAIVSAKGTVPVLTASRTQTERAQGTVPLSNTGAAWIPIGIAHILEGYDHLLFVFALLLGAGTLGASIRLVTAFTAGHSISLALAATGVVGVPASIVEPGIAASIVAMAVLGIAGSGARTERTALTFAFGLLHGLGFASALVDAGIGSGSTSQLLVSLFCFNLGVEIGQLAFAGVALPALALVRQRPGFEMHGMRWCSAAVAACGMFWFVQRLSAS